ncbi:type II secretion system F family protein [Saccharopolyspora rosea]|uniref:Type II secretion system F family protein n=1 Tax=Saccharopolyspora rosea TaxID=524884 RepID=A0ABW3FR60_9PSEU|nr:type II secretion system F family protein [Saccharopolyspora rosea]
MLTLLAAGLLCWPDGRARARLRGPRAVRIRARRWDAVARRAVVPAIAVAGFLLAGAGGLCATVGVALIGARYWRSRQEFRRGLALSDEFSAGLRLLVAQLRTGAHPAVAAAGAAAESGPVIAAVFHDLAAVARLGGDVGTALSRSGPEGLRAPLARMARAWTLAERHGIALADLLDSVRRDVERRTRFRRSVEAGMAGPRSTAAILIVLPVFGLLLGEAVGAAPLTVLASTPTGQVLLLVGAGLVCAGTAWTLRLTGAVVR